MHQWNAGEYQAKAGFVADLGMPVLRLLQPEAGEHILDLGCGDGSLTDMLRQQNCIVVGVDSSEDMVSCARARGLDARRMDGQNLRFTRQFDAVFSNAALHWMQQTDAVIHGVAKSLKPGGRFVGEFGGHGNIAAIVTAFKSVLPDYGCPNVTDVLPWYFPSVEEYRQKLIQGGFRIRSMELIPRPTRLDVSLGDWLDVFATGILVGFPGREDSIKNDVLALLDGVLCDSSGTWTVDYVRLRFAACLE